MTRQTLTVDIPGNEWLTANGRYGDPRARGRRVKRLRARACLLARSQGLTPVAGLVRIVAVVQGRVNVRSDPNNAADATKAIVDGLRDARVLVDDDHTRVIGPDHRWGQPDPTMPRGFHRITLTITPTQ